jgi:hypothetical protein
MMFLRLVSSNRRMRLTRVLCDPSCSYHDAIPAVQLSLVAPHLREPTVIASVGEPFAPSRRIAMLEIACFGRGGICTSCS